MKTYLMEEMTWPEVEEAIIGGKHTVIIPIAAIEQHGPHLPLNTDVLIGNALSVGVAAALQDALVASAICPGCSEHHLAFAGSLSIPESLLEKIITAYCDNLKNYGFKNIVLLPSHGGNFDAVTRAGKRLKAEYEEKGVNVIALTDRMGYINAFAEPLYPYGFSFDQVGVHAGAGETTIVMALRPDFVREERFEAGFVGKIDIPKLLQEGVKGVSSNGVLGDPRGTNAEMGQKTLNYMVEKYAKLIREQISCFK